ncbi:MAG TPA: hypothetical protein VE783_12080 [Candidatus Limnocylindrales bacterium]|nr:hypothetical protein [Candidatus Limnocylindrales bacterium]
MRFRLFPLVALFLAFACSALLPQELRIPLPKKSKYTPVQQLNRQGVQALQKKNVDRAKRYFYRAYLIDPNDPFTLNNLGYVAELEGDVDRAQRYYDQAQANTSEAIVDQSTEPTDKGKPVAKIAGRTAEGQMKVNQLNVEALRLLNNDRAPEADLLLQQALKIDANNPFTLNNMGFAKEKEGELEEAIRSYTRAAQTGSKDPVIVAMKVNWRGRPVSEVAAENAEQARKELARASNVEDQVARLNLRGVSAMNRNERKTASEDFQRAYKLDPNNSFTINNMGYLAEIEGDKESAQSYYEQARNARRASARVAVATRPEVEGQAVGQVADQSTSLVDAAIQSYAEERRRTAGPPVLRTRDNRPVPEPTLPANQTQPQQQPPANNNQLDEPVLIPRGQQQQQQPPEQQSTQPPQH